MPEYAGCEAGAVQITNTFKSRKYQSMLRYIDWTLKMGPFCLIKKGECDVQNLLSSRLYPDDPPLVWSGSKFMVAYWKFFKKPPVFILTHMFIVYLGLKFAGSSVLLYQYQKLMKMHKIQMQMKQTQQDNTSGSFDLDALEQLSDRIRIYSEWIESIGVPLATSQGIGLLILSCIGAGSFLFYQFNVYLAWRDKYRLRSDLLGFIFSPLGERARLAQELDAILKKLSSALPSNYLIPQDCLTFSNTPEVVAIHEREKTLFRHNIKRLVKNRNKPDGSDLEWPYTLRARFLANFYRLHNFTLRFTRILATRLYLALITGLVIAEFYSRANERFRRTKERIPTVDFHLDVFRMSPLSLASDQKAYTASDGTQLQLFMLAFSIEAKYYFTVNRLIYVIELFLFGFFVSHMASYIGGFSIMSAIYRIAWITHLVRKMNSLLTRVRQYQGRGTHRHASKSPEISSITRSMIVLYLDFELFRRQNQSYQRIIGVMTTQVSIFSLIALISSYLTAIDIQLTSKAIVIFACACVMMLSNICLALCAFKTKQVMNLMKQVNYLMAISASDELSLGPIGLKLSIPIDLWRRQLLNDGESKYFYATRVLGSHITYENLLSMNAYFVAICLLMIKISNQ